MTRFSRPRIPSSLPYLFALCVAVLVLYQFSANPSREHYLGFAELQWSPHSPCSAQGFPPETRHAESAVGSWSENSSDSFRCTSDPLPIQGNVVEFFYSGTPQNEGLRIEVQYSGSPDWNRIDLPPLEGLWSYHRLILPSLHDSSSLRLRLADTDSQGWLGIRNRVTFYDRSSSFADFRLRPLRPLLIITTAFFLSLLLQTMVIRAPSQFSQFCLYVALTTAIFYRLDLYFYWDEWKTIERFQSLGVAAVFQTHNEHFVPFFFFFYYLETLLYRDHYFLYLLTTFLLHAANTLFLARVLRTLTSVPTVATFLSLIFLLYGIHAEVLQWAFLQAIQLSQLCLLGSLITAKRYFERGKHTDALLTGLLLVSSPLFFGGGFLAFLIHPIFQVLWFSSKNSNSSSTISLTRCSNRQIFFCYYALALLLALFSYLLHRTGIGHGLSADTFSQFWAKSAHLPVYLYVGVLFGTFGRGLGLFLENNSREIALSVSHYILLGAIVMILYFRFKTTTYRFHLLRLFAGLFITLLPFLLTALGRAHLGDLLSLIYRYQYLALPGFLIFLLPLTELLFLKHSALTSARLKSSLFMFLVLLTTAWIAAQLRFLIHYQGYLQTGLRNRQFVAELKEWDELRSRWDEDRLSSPYPLVPTYLAPDFHLNNACRVLKHLGSADRDFACKMP